MNPVPTETFDALQDFPFCHHLFIGRIQGVDVNAPRETALSRLAQRHAEITATAGFSSPVIAEQVHGNGIARVEAFTPEPLPGVDGLITNRPGVCLGIRVADCGTVYLLDPVRHCIGLVHSGKKGTELGIVPAAIERMALDFGSDPGDLIVQLSPCIRPPFYEIDFARQITDQCRKAGVERIHDCGTCTASDPRRYYSYRAELGKTGRMLALFELKGDIVGA